MLLCSKREQTNIARHDLEIFEIYVNAWLHKKHKRVFVDNIGYDTKHRHY